MSAGCPERPCAAGAARARSAGKTLLLELRARLVLRLAAGERLRLREKVRQQLVVVVAEWRCALGGGDEIARDEVRALVDELVEGVLPVGARLAPDDRARRVVDAAGRRGARTCRCSPCRPAGDRRGSDAGTGRRAGSRAVVAPRKLRYQMPSSAKSRPADCSSSGAVRKCSSIAWAPSSSSIEALHADGERDRQADRGPQRVAAADPVPELEHVLACRCRTRSTSFAFVETRDEVLRDAASRRAPSSARRRALSAFVIVSCVVKVFDATMKSVRSRIEPRQRLGRGARRRRSRRNAAADPARW